MGSTAGGGGRGQRGGRSRGKHRPAGGRGFRHEPVFAPRSIGPAISTRRRTYAHVPCGVGSVCAGHAHLSVLGVA